MTNKFKNILNNTTIKIFSTIFIILSILFFEFGYCNSEFIYNIVNNEQTSYNFSACRIVFYLIFIVLYFVFRKKFITEAIETINNNKFKRVIIYLAIIALIVCTIIGTMTVLRNPIVTRAISIGLITAYLGTIFVMYISNNAVKNTILLACTLGMVFTITTDYNHPLDEKRHFVTAFNVANFNFDYSTNQITDEDFEKIPHLTKYTDINESLATKYEEKLIEVNLEDSPSTATSYPFYSYIFSAIGIFIAKTLNGSIIDIYIIGRIFSLALYTILIAIAVKIMPFKKNVLFALAFMPMSLVLAASYSIDGLCIGTVFIFIAYCMKIYKESETISLKQFLILAGLFLLMLTAKSMSYILVAIIALMLPIFKTLKKNKKYLPIIITLSIIVIISMILGVFYIKDTKLVADTRGGDTNTSSQMDILLSNPKHDVELAINHFKDTLVNFDWYCNLHPSAFFTDDAPYFMFMLLLYIFYIALTETDHQFKVKDKIIMTISFLGVFAMTSLAMYIAFTEIGELHIAGYQTRYIIPILPLILFGVSSKYISNKENANRVMKVGISTSILVVIGLAQLILG